MAPGLLEGLPHDVLAIEKAVSNQAMPTDSLNEAAKEALDAMTQAGAYQ